MTSLRRVLIVQPSLQPPGGGQAVAAWMIEALKDRYDVTVAAWQAADLAAVDRCYGTSLQGSRVAIQCVPTALRRLLKPIPLRLALLRASLLARHARRLAQTHHVLVSADNELALGPRAIQYVHYPRQLRPRPLADIRWYHRPKTLLDLYYVVCDRLAHSREGFATNTLLVNSTWTGERVARMHGVAVRIVYPPVPGDFPDVPWADRELGFLCIGRFAEEKELERVVEILAEVRRSVPDVHLHLVGGRDSRRYYRRIARLARIHRTWIRLHENLSRPELVQLVASQRYGIHAMREEHFGIAPAEMVRAGCIVFVPDGGGQVEIVGSEAPLRYRTNDDAVAKIVSVLTDPGEQTRLRAHLAMRRELFSVERFVQTIRSVVDAVDRGVGQESET